MVNLISVQRERWTRLDPRLPQFSPPTSSSIESIQNEGDHKPVVSSVQGDPYCIAFPQLTKIEADSDALVYFEEVTGSVIELAIRDVESKQAASSIVDIMRQLEDFWLKNGATAAIIYWPTRESVVGHYLESAQFILDSYIAVRFDVDRMDIFDKMPNPEVNIRIARPEDENDILELQLEVVRAHIPHAPFAREIPTATVGIRKRLQAFWSGESVEDGGSLFMLAEIDKAVVGMAECQLHAFQTAPGALLSHGRYGLVNTFGVSARFRRKGIGNVLERAISRIFEEWDVDGSYLIYSPYNESASGFWSTRGYDPLWTLYQKRAFPNAAK